MSDEKVLPPSAGELGKGGEAENYTQNTPSYLDEDTDKEVFVKQGWLGGAGSSFDAWLSTAAAQIGQVMLAMPHAVSLVGMRAAIPIIVVYTACSMFTIHLLTTLFVDNRRRKIKAGTWAGGHDKRATQYFEVLGDLTGSKIVRYFVLAVTILSLLCTGIAQIVSCATGMYYLHDTIDKRYDIMCMLSCAA